VKKAKDQGQINAFLGKDTEYEGKLSFMGAVRIDGRFKGEILSEGTLIVGETAVLHSQIHVSHLIVSGEVHGDIIAEKRIEIHAPGKVFGNMQAPKISIEEGVIFEGNCKMNKKDEAEARKVQALTEVKGAKSEGNEK